MYIPGIHTQEILHKRACNQNEKERYDENQKNPNVSPAPATCRNPASVLQFMNPAR